MQAEPVSQPEPPEPEAPEPKDEPEHESRDPKAED
jgi:hypothetical protein